MINHLVFLNFNKGTTAQQIEELKKGFAEMCTAVPNMTGRCGTSVDMIGMGDFDDASSPVKVTRYEFCAYATFPDDAAFKVFMGHPAHMHFGQTYVLPVVAEMAPLQFVT